MRRSTWSMLLPSSTAARMTLPILLSHATAATCTRAQTSGVDAETGLTVPLFHPRKDVWEDHFHFQEGTILGRTACGRATVHVLSMNATERARLRLEVNAREQLG